MREEDLLGELGTSRVRAKLQWRLTEDHLSLKFYMDHNVHAGITPGLRDRGIDCLTAYEDNMASAEDGAILIRATELGRIVFSQDVDFLGVCRRSGWGLAREFAGVICARQMGITIGRAISDLELYAMVLEPPELRNSVEWIPLA